MKQAKFLRPLIPVLAWLFALSIWALLAIWGATWVQPLQERATDLVWRVGGLHAEERRLVLVDIDELSLKELGAWPWERERTAQLMQKLSEHGVDQQIWDIVFADERHGVSVLKAQIQQSKPILSQIFALPGQGDDIQGGQLAGALNWPSCPAPFETASGYLGNHADLTGAGTLVGHITPRLSHDGIVRYQPAVLCFQGRAYGALALAALMQAGGEDNLALVRGSGWLDPQWFLQGAQGAFPPVPLHANGDVRMPWRLAPDSFVSISAADLLANRVPPDLLRNAWVLVGSSAFGLNDRIATPFSSAAAGMQAHAQFMLAAMDGRVPYTPKGHLLLQIGAVLLGMGLLTVLQLRRRSAPQSNTGRFSVFSAQWLPLAAVGWIVLLLLAHAVLLLCGNLWVAWLPAAAAVLGAALLWAGLEHARSRKDRDRLYSHLSSYLPQPVAAALALQPPSSAIKASIRQVSVMFADIRNFSAYCEQRPPEEAAAVLHAFFSRATDIVEAEGGVIEAFQGDAVLAVWYDGAADNPSHAQSALRAAVRLSAGMQGVLPDPAPAGLEPLALGIGLECGPAMVGSFGRASRRTHMVLGNTVTIANRLVAMTMDLSHPILVGEGMAAQVGASRLESMGTFMLDGMRVPHHICAYPLTPGERDNITVHEN
ncbi:adenylate/guanylate cyclase domain-containing protein [Acidovorax sp. CCYZU-2555]|uniref:CHASE2 domain-containing protein n=1 Tax=Acidovorax sp. CCYZU-2555 TaxID=2835042 RepID=UPI0024BDA0EE|nr:adenylate/guanylate cyclase domain-containing protein [Acidovorax sp. CCYZU-2555]